jgi:murein DD-endopeptidase MepM/ murein hydrolase activator NlpD
MERKGASRMGRKCLILFSFLFSLYSCKDDVVEETIEVVEPEPHYEFGFNLDDYIVKRDTVKSGDSFGQILQRNNLGYSKIFKINEAVRDSFDTRRITVGKPYTLLCDNDSLQKPLHFIYQPTREKYIVVNFEDSIQAFTETKQIKYIEKEIAGVITSNISSDMEKLGESVLLAYKMSDVYAWTIDFSRLQKDDKFKVIYTEKYIDDTIYAGIDEIKAAYFEHNKEPFYAFNFITDSVKGIKDYYSDKAKSMRGAFLKSPVDFMRISSRYNLNRRIALYGNRVRPHKGTDFAAAIGTPIKATANGTVIKSEKRGGNGNYVKIKHNSTYSTQYLHMKKRKVRIGDFVKQGDVIGWVGMTGNTSGPHVCYRFWKNGKQVDPFREKLPESESIEDSLKPKYLEFIKPLKSQLDAIKLKVNDDNSNLEIKNDSLIKILN